MDLGNRINNNMNMNMGRMPMRSPYQILPHYEIIKVKGEAGARSIQMDANSSILLLDESGAIVWLAQTDGAGYLTVAPFDVKPHQTQPPIDLNDLDSRLRHLEELYAKQSNSGVSKSNKKQRNAATAADESTDSTN